MYDIKSENYDELINKNFLKKIKMVIIIVHLYKNHLKFGIQIN